MNRAATPALSISTTCSAACSLLVCLRPVCQGAEHALPDLFEAFNIGLDVVPSEPFYRDAPHAFFAANLWTSAPSALPELRPALTRYFDYVAYGLSDPRQRKPKKRKLHVVNKGAA